MTEQNTTQTTPETVPTEDVPVELTRLQKFNNNHPRASRVLAIGGVVGSALGLGLLVNNLRNGKPHLDAAGEHVLEAAGEFSEAVSPTSANTDV